MKTVIFLLLLIPQTSFARWVTPDFKIGASATSFRSPAALTDVECKAQIAAAACLVDPPKSDSDDQDRPCLDGSADYAHFFTELYDRYPAHLQKMLCHLKRIYIEKEFIGSAYAGLLTEPGHEDHVLGGIVGIRRSLLDHPSDFAAWASWKEQLHFGTDPNQVAVAPGLPQVTTSMNEGQADMLYFTIAHELGHIFDFTNSLNSFTGTPATPKPGSWGELSWKTAEQPLDGDNFPLRASLCFYFCNGTFLSADRQDALYQSLAKTGFISAYATRLPTEDFADTFAFYTIMTERRATYAVHTASGLRYDPLARLAEDPLLQPKRRFIEAFLASDYHFPGD